MDKNINIQQIDKEVGRDVAEMKKWGCPVHNERINNNIFIYANKKYGNAFCIDEDRAREMLFDVKIDFGPQISYSHTTTFYLRKMSLNKYINESHVANINSPWNQYEFYGFGKNGKENAFKKGCIDLLLVKMIKGI